MKVSENRNINRLYFLQCPNCHSPEINADKRFINESLQLKKDVEFFSVVFYTCDNCGLTFINPQPTDDVLNFFYAKDYGCYTPQLLTPLKKIKRVLKLWVCQNSLMVCNLDKRDLLKIRKSILGFLLQLIGVRVPYCFSFPFCLDTSTKMLDYGYGSGDWLKDMHVKRYVNLYGYDIGANLENIKVLQDIGINIINANSIETEKNLFGVIRFNHVAEHLRNPVQTFKECYNLLEDEGFLLISVPSINSFSWRLFKDNFSSLDKPRHLFHYTPASLKSVIENSGYRIVSTQNAGKFSVFFDSLLKNKKCTRFARLVLEVIGFILQPAYSAISTIFISGEEIFVIAQKVSKK